jgi:hypothetical protein
MTEKEVEGILLAPAENYSKRKGVIFERVSRLEWGIKVVKKEWCTDSVVIRVTFDEHGSVRDKEVFKVYSLEDGFFEGIFRKVFGNRTSPATSRK